MAQDVRWCNSVVVLLLPCLVAICGFHPYTYACSHYYKHVAAVHNSLNSPTCPKELFGDLFILVKRVIHIFYFVSVQGVIIIFVQGSFRLFVSAQKLISIFQPYQVIIKIFHFCASCFVLIPPPPPPGQPIKWDLVPPDTIKGMPIPLDSRQSNGYTTL